MTRLGYNYTGIIKDPQHRSIPSRKGVGPDRSEMATSSSSSCNATSPRLAGCQLILFRHIIKTGGSTVRQIFQELASPKLAAKASNSDSGAAWVASLMYAAHFSSNTPRKVALARWIEAREAEARSGRLMAEDESTSEPSYFLEYHVETDGGRLLAYDAYDTGSNQPTPPTAPLHPMR